MDQLDEVRDVALLRSAKYKQALRWYHSQRVRGWAFNIGDLVLCLLQSRKDCHKLSPLWEGPYVIVEVLRPSAYKPRPSTVESSPMPRTSSSYVAFTLNKRTLSLISFANKLPDL